ncbi:hypothetical protein [Tuwongella immobilis]|uniref:Uncharacterized protein n=1 Tax=Tuwongella immobilis TaxID=692036 RepID=A0A6C2YK54_9BACT|nr:hypothetical protein [Tuwongella immobilis]VIP01483.1 unnamed protein product [Tuwongella immobilis]VTR98541.1 unnamed protein product [Tuwongella immobilis]
MTDSFMPRSNRRGYQFEIAIGVVILLIGGIWLVQEVNRVRVTASRMASL